MVIRIWKTRVNPERLHEYEEFEESSSSPMFLQQPGFLACFFVRSDEDCAAITLWEDEESVEALATSTSYLETASRLEQTQMLIGEQTVRRFRVHRCLLAPGSVEYLVNLS